MIRKIIIVVLTLGAVGLAMPFPITLLGPVSFEWKTPPRALEVDNQALSVRSEYELAIYPRTRHGGVPCVSLQGTRFGAKRERHFEPSFDMLGFAYHCDVEGALFSRHMFGAYVPFWFLSIVSAGLPLFLVVRRPPHDFRFRTRILLITIYATIGTLAALDIASTLRSRAIALPLVTSAMILMLWGVLLVTSSTFPRNVSASRNIRVKRWLLVAGGVAAQFPSAGLVNVVMPAYGYLHYYSRGEAEVTLFAVTHLLVCVVAASWFVSILTKKAGLLRGYCHCGYDLTGNESGVCPECGMEIEAT